MSRHSSCYSADLQSKSSELAAKILGANTAAEVTAVIAAVESHLKSHSQSPEQNRHFFSIAFPALICKLFGFNDNSNDSSTLNNITNKPSGWLDSFSSSSSSDGALSGKLFSLLSPDGTLIDSILAVDRLSLVKYVFPLERLPEWVRLMLSSTTTTVSADVDISDLCPPLFKNRINQQDGDNSSNFQHQQPQPQPQPQPQQQVLQLNVLDYFIFWFAYYPVSTSNNANTSNDPLTAASTSSIRRNLVRLDNWTKQRPPTQHQQQQTTQFNSLYLKLLYAYLSHFVPMAMDDLTPHQTPYRTSLLHYSSTIYDDSLLHRAHFFVHTLIHYWLVDNDFSPFSLHLCNSFRLSFPFRSLLAETPPSSGLGQVLNLFLSYLNLSSASAANSVYDNNNNNTKFGSKRETASLLPPGIASSAGGPSWNSYIQRPLYRFLLRTLLFCPVESSLKNISDVFSVWVSYIQPWKLNKDLFSDLEPSVDTSKKNKLQPNDEPGYSMIWQGYVLSNYLFYTSLVMHFIGFAHKFLHADAQAVLHMVSKVLDILTSSRELLELLKDVDAIFHSKNSGSSKSMLNNLSKFVPQIREQLKDWEDGLSESDADGSLLHENWNRDLRLFSDGEDGGPQLLQLFILRAETELSTITSDSQASNLQSLASLKSRLHSLFGDYILKQAPVSPRKQQLQQFRDDLFKPRRVGNGSFTNVKYKGDWMRRPISDDEVAWLAKLLILLSTWVNESLGLNQPEGQQPRTSCSFVEVPSDSVNEYGASESCRALLYAIASWFVKLRFSIARIMIQHGLKVNLRVLASKKVVMVFIVFGLFSMLRRAFRSFW